MATVLAFDFGASTGRAILGRFDGERLDCREIHRFDNVPVRENGRLCWDFPRLLNQVRHALTLCGQVDSMAFDTWGVDYGLLSAEGELLGLPVHYRDGRTAGMVERAFEAISPEALYRATGSQIMPINTLFQLMAEEGERRQARTLLFMPDLLAWALCGAVSAERTIASTSQLVDPATGEWNDKIVALTGFGPSLFPPIVDSATRCGEYNGIPILKAAGHDTQCAVAAMPWDGQREAAFLSCGTWSLIGCELDSPVLTPKSMADQLSNELGANGKINYLKNISGLWLIQELRRNLREEGRDHTYDHMERLAREEPPFRSFIDPDGEEFAAPGGMPDKLRAFCRRTGQPVPETDGALVRCIYESLAMKYRYAIGQLQENTGKRFEALHLLGGGVKDTFLCQMTADSLAIPVIAGPIEATALGSLLLQLVALGELDSVAAGRRLLREQETVTTYVPRETEEWAAAYERFCGVVGG